MKISHWTDIASFKIRSIQVRKAYSHGKFDIEFKRLGGGSHLVQYIEPEEILTFCKQMIDEWASEDERHW